MYICVKLIIGDLNFSPYPSHPTSAYTCEVTTLPKVRGGDILVTLFKIAQSYICIIIWCVNGIVVPRYIWVLNPDLATWPIAPISFYPKPQSKPTWTTGLSFATWSLLRKLFPSNKERMMFKYTIPCIPSSALGSIAAEHIYWSRNQFQGHSHHVPLPPNHPFTINDIGPPIALAMEVIIVSPLISSYKYEKLEEEKGCWKVPKEIENKEREYESEGEGEVASPCLCAENNPK